MSKISDSVRFEQKGNLAIVSLNRLSARNAVNGELAEALEQRVEQIERSQDIWVAILTSASPEVFCAGADLKELALGKVGMNRPETGFAGFVDYPRRKPWIAAVRGNVLGGGCELCLACDMIVAGESACFGLPEVKRGLLAGAGGVFRLPRALPRHIGLELVATGDPITADAARKWGLVNRLVKDSSVIEAAIELAHRIIANSPIAVRESLSIARKSGELTDAELYEMTRAAYERIGKSQDMKEGLSAFAEKRGARWQNG